jgi:uncharacterized protein (DUF433 family)
MIRDELLLRISIDPEVCFGKPCIKGHRIWVSLILDFLASGMTVQEILQQYPALEKADILGALRTERRWHVRGWSRFPWSLSLETQTRREPRYPWDSTFTRGGA